MARFVVLGSAAGGGVPQWNCRCPVCQLAWAGDARVRRRSQSSLAVTIDDDNFVLLNASPDLRQQIVDRPALHPRAGRRDSPIRAVIATSADVDHIAGLLTLREKQKFKLHATAATLAAIADNPVFAVLSDECVKRESIELAKSFEPIAGLQLEAFAAPGKVALWQESGDVAVGEEGETTIALEMKADGKRVVYAPACAKVTPAMRERLSGADVLFFDGTTYTDDELLTQGLMQKSARRMGHLSMSGPDGSIAALADLPIGRKIFVHINNSNPALIEGSPEHRAVEAAGWEIAYDGMEIAL
jgi:pyrroloquinoline quinone biosynthesis protein B